MTFERNVWFNKFNYIRLDGSMLRLKVQEKEPPVLGLRGYGV
jgi:hypothetical protein